MPTIDWISPDDVNAMIRSTFGSDAQSSFDDDGYLVIHTGLRQETGEDGEPVIRRAEAKGRIASTIRKSASLTEVDKQAILNEDGVATNLHKLDLAGTHYELDGDEALWALML